MVQRHLKAKKDAYSSEDVTLKQKLPGTPLQHELGLNIECVSLKSADLCCASV